MNTERLLLRPPYREDVVIRGSITLFKYIRYFIGTTVYRLLFSLLPPSSAHGPTLSVHPHIHNRVVQKLFNIFSSNPQRWEILQKKIGCSLHSLSQTRWSARVECVKPFAAHIPGITEAIIEIETLNLTPETRFDIKGIKSYMVL